MTGGSAHLLDKIQALEFIRERRDLFDSAGHLNPFACSAWMLHVVEQVAEDDWTIVLPESRAGGLSVMPLYSTRSSPHQCAALTNYYASLYSPLVSSASDRGAAIGALVDQLVDSRPRRATLRFAPLDRECADTTALKQALSARGWYVKEYFCFGNWYLPCAGLSFEDYMSGRDSQLYNTWARKSKKFRAGNADNAHLEIITDPAGTEAAMAAYERVYAKSWKTPEPYPRFVPGWARICAEHGWLRLGLAWIGDVPIAAQLWFTMHRRSYIFKLAYDEEYAKWSAGTVLTAHMMRHSLEQDRVIEIDYLTGDDAYKKSWMTTRRERVGLIACNPRTARGLMAGAREFAGEIRRRWRPSR